MVALLLIGSISTSHGFYLPGVAPQDFAQVGREQLARWLGVPTYTAAPQSTGCLCISANTPLQASRRSTFPVQGDPITIKVNKLNSVKNVPFEFYSLPYCKPEKLVSSAENLGEVLRGDRILNSLYLVRGGAQGRRPSFD